MISWLKVTRALDELVWFASGFVLGQLYYRFSLKDIPFPRYSGVILSLVLSVILGIGNLVSRQLRCIFVLKIPMFCGKPGRGVLKAVILTFIVTGPITNMGLNAREVVRVFACSTQLAHNLSRMKYNVRVGPVRRATLEIKEDVELVKDTFRTMNDIVEPLQRELEDTNETKHIGFENDLVDDVFKRRHRSDLIEKRFQFFNFNENFTYDFHRKKLRYRCENQLSRASAVCFQQFRVTHAICCDLIPNYAEHAICQPLAQRETCDLVADLTSNGSKANDICEAPVQPGLMHGLAALRNIKKEFVDSLNNVHLQYKLIYQKELLDIQDATETGERVKHAFEEKTIVMHHVLTVMNICMALLYLRLFNSAMKYHDCYLTNIDYDNVYITGYFKRLDDRRQKKNICTLLPLKKMERNRYIDIYSLSYMGSQRSNLVMQILKVMLEVVTATTFVMLDRLFFEALEVVRQHAEMEPLQPGTRDLDIEVEGNGILSTLLRKFLETLTTTDSNAQVLNSACLPRPRQMPYIYFLKIYGGYIGIVILLFVSPYTMRLRRLICSHFYPHREKQRILHLYNDILKNRMKMHKTLRRKAVQSVRAHYLSGDILSLLSARMRFPGVCDWLRALPAARMACLICGETEPRMRTRSSWHSCLGARCPFVYCAECWREAGARCLACDPALADLSDVDSLTDDEPLKY